MRTPIVYQPSPSAGPCPGRFKVNQAESRHAGSGYGLYRPQDVFAGI